MVGRAAHAAEAVAGVPVHQAARVGEERPVLAVHQRADGAQIDEGAGALDDVGDVGLLEGREVDGEIGHAVLLAQEDARGVDGGEGGGLHQHGARACRPG